MRKLLLAGVLATLPSLAQAQSFNVVGPDGKPDAIAPYTGTGAGIPVQNSDGTYGWITATDLLSPDDPDEDTTNEIGVFDFSDPDPANWTYDPGNGVIQNISALVSDPCGGVTITSSDGAVAPSPSGCVFDITDPNPLVDPGQSVMRMSADANALSIGKTVDTHTRNETAYGFAAGENANGSENTWVGVRAGHNANVTSSNIGVGFFAMRNANLGQSNTAVGQSALFGAAGTDRNTAIGLLALRNGTNLFRATGVGDSAGDGSDGVENTFIGAQTNQTAPTTNSTALGYNARVTASNQIMLGNASVAQVVTSGDLVANGTLYPSDEGLKVDVADVDTNALLDAMASLDVISWRWDEEAAVLVPAKETVVESVDPDTGAIQQETLIENPVYIIAPQHWDKAQIGVSAQQVEDAMGDFTGRIAPGTSGVDYARLAAVGAVAAAKGTKALEARLDAVPYFQRAAQVVLFAKENTASYPNSMAALRAADDANIEDGDYEGLSSGDRAALLVRDASKALGL